MAKKKSKSNGNVTLANGAAAVLALLVIISLFFSYYTIKSVVGNSTTTGWKIMGEDGDSNVKTYLILSLVFAIITALVGVLRLLKFPIFKSKLFAFILIGLTVALLLFAILAMAALKDNSFSVGNVANGKLGIGVILNLIFSILAVLSALGAFILDK